MPNMQKIKSAFELGQTTRKTDLCNSVFECAERNADIAIPDPMQCQGKRIPVVGLAKCALG